MHSSTRGVISGGYEDPSTVDTMEYIQFQQQDMIDFGNLTSAVVCHDRCNVKWSWRFRIMSDIKINNITDRSGKWG